MHGGLFLSLALRRFTIEQATEVISSLHYNRSPDLSHRSTRNRSASVCARRTFSSAVSRQCSLYNTAPNSRLQCSSGRLVSAETRDTMEFTISSAQTLHIHEQQNITPLRRPKVIQYCNKYSRWKLFYSSFVSSNVSHTWEIGADLLFDRMIFVSRRASMQE